MQVVRTATGIQIHDGEYTYVPNWSEIRAKLGVAENPKEVKAFFRDTVPNLTDAELIALVAGPCETCPPEEE